MSVGSSAPSLDTVWQYAPGPSNSATQFGERHDLHGWALPFRGHVVDTIELLEELGAYLAGRPGSCQRVTKNTVRNGVSVADSFWENVDLVEHAMLVHGWWLGGTTTVGRYYCNPDYYHRHPESDIATDRDERREMLQQTAAMGVLNPSEVAPMFGFQSEGLSAGNTVSKTAHRLNVAWGDRREAGWRKIGRTWKTLNQWGYSHREIGRAFDKPHSVVGREIRRVPDFQPPGDPTAEVIPR